MAISSCGGPVARWPGGPVARWPGGRVGRWPGGPGVVEVAVRYTRSCRARPDFGQPVTRW
ncbi:hypothetical protein DNK48_37870 [Streptomyces malaysiensis subsp. malaysiensis]|nr:hypothetical protein DNK48_37870 [Streptomyces malaysiensis]